MFCVIITKSFEKSLWKVIKKDKHVVGIYERVIWILASKPFDGTNVRKLVNIELGAGVWRIRQGNYRIRYDVYGKNVVLHSIRDRKDSYR